MMIFWRAEIPATEINCLFVIQGKWLQVKICLNQNYLEIEIIILANFTCVIHLVASIRISLLVGIITLQDIPPRSKISKREREREKPNKYMTQVTKIKKIRSLTS